MTAKRTAWRGTAYAAVACAAWIAFASLAYGENTMAGTPDILENGYFRVVHEGGGITSLRVDATGAGTYGEETVAAGGAITGAGVPTLNGSTLTFPDAGTVAWPLPFVRAGYYDADARLQYPGVTVADAAPCLFPVRKIVTSNGHTVFLEYFKRNPLGHQGLWLNLKNGSTFVLFGEPELGGHLEVHCPGQNVAYTSVAEDSLTLSWNPTSGPVSITVHERGALPEQGVLPPTMAFSPDFDVVFDETGKSAAASPLATDLLRMAMFWHPETIANGEWVFDAIRTFRYVDTRSDYDNFLRNSLINSLALLGYDRFEHFGMVFNWGQYPDYGAGGLLNIPANNGAYDMRFLHVNAMYILAVAEYVMATGDTSILDVRPARYVATDGDQPQPICGGDADTAHHVLAAGDRRLDGAMPTNVFSLGQSFRATAPFRRVTLQLGAGTALPGAPTGVTARIWVKRLDTGETIADKDQALVEGRPVQTVSVMLPEPAPAGDYEVRVSDRRSGAHYFGPGITWRTKAEGDYADGQASFGPFSGDIYDELQTVFAYLYENTGARTEDLSYYQDDREYNIEDQKSGRALVTMQNSYHECLGGGYDAMMGLWYPPACRAMADLARLRGDTDAESRYLELADRAKTAYNETYWHEVQENGRTFHRYFGVRDWDDVVHDYGFTYYNLEAASFGIPSQQQAQDILWWLDTGYWRPDPEGPWQEDIYSIWQISEPFNTLEINGWVGITGKLPYLQVLSNGGTRLLYGARGLTARARYLSIDNMHERNCQVLARFASPDRLTGGRTVDDPGGRGRWHFGAPHADRADIEGYREIFPGNGSLGEAQVSAYLGAELRPNSLALFPRVPSSLDSLSLGNIGYRGCVFDFEVEALRTTVPATPGAVTQNTWEFTPAGPFSKAGLQARYDDSGVPFKQGALVDLVLERKDGTEWTPLTRNWMRYVRNREWVWVNAETSLPPGSAYRLRILHASGPEDRLVTVDTGGADTPDVRFETRRFRAGTAHCPPGATPVLLAGGATVPLAPEAEVVLQPGQHLWLTLDPSAEGEGEGEGEEPARHSADRGGDGRIGTSDLLGVVQYYNAGALHCDHATADGYAPGGGDTASCPPHDSNYVPRDWRISLTELLRLVQLFNAGGYSACDTGEDGYCPAAAVEKGHVSAAMHSLTRDLRARTAVAAS